MRSPVLIPALLLSLWILAASSPAASADASPSASGGSHLTVHDVFGLDTLVFQTFGFTATIKSDGHADG